MEIRKILCAVDFSDCSVDAVEKAAGMAERFGAELVLLHVFQPPAYAFPDGGFLFPSKDELAQLYQRIDRGLGDLRDRAKSHGATRVEVATSQGIAWEQVVRAAVDGGYDLIVIGTHGRTGVRHLVTGSTAERVVRHAACPVLTVRHRA